MVKKQPYAPIKISAIKSAWAICMNDELLSAHRTGTAAPDPSTRLNSVQNEQRHFTLAGQENQYLDSYSCNLCFYWHPNHEKINYSPPS
jgi:hypothetical protein